MNCFINPNNLIFLFDLIITLLLVSMIIFTWNLAIEKQETVAIDELPIRKILL